MDLKTDGGMNFTSNIFNRDGEILTQAFSHISKYCAGDIIITDSKFNILFQNSRYDFKNNKFEITYLTSGFENKNLVINFENFKNSSKNHFYVKLIFNDKNNFSAIPMDVHICKIKNKSGQLKGYSVIVQDITQEIKNKIQKETFIDILTHDLKNPIRANIQVLELILKNRFGVLEIKLKNVLDELLNSCRFMNYMTDNLLIKYKNEFNLYELQKQRYSIVNLVKEKCLGLSGVLDKKNQTVEFIVKGRIKYTEIDVDEIGKVINNLIINASEQSCNNSKIIIQIENQDDEVKVSFIDFGYPRRDEYLGDIFEEFIMCSNKFRKIGYSLELYNCRKIIEAHNGVIRAQNRDNKGTAITFSLPVCD